ncbi:MAG: hypothetical protein MIO92_11445 [Methanosarcinaceae archaeon]|nr:hypothetical protein [Methanosarcinaceae archaeon]
MLYQLHHRYPEGETIFIDQKDIKSESEMKEFIKETIDKHPIKKGAIWMACNEESEYFVMKEDKKGKQT